MWSSLNWLATGTISESLTYVANYTNTNPNVPWVIFLLWRGLLLALKWERKEMFYLTMHTHFIYGYMASDIMVKYHSDSERQPAAVTWATLTD